MTEKRWQQITQLFTRALEIEDSERGTWLQQACGNDTELLNEVHSLLEARTAGGPLDVSVQNLQELAVSSLEGMLFTNMAIGPYRLEERIGSGGMGMVYKARDTRLMRTVAIKFLPPGLRRNESAKMRFVNEARMAATLDHPNICTVFETGESGEGVPYMVMRYYEGKTLRDILEQGPLPLHEALDIAMQTAKGLAAAHDEGMVHRDIKPSNLIITNDGTVKILDFGIAKAEDAGLTKTGQRPGTAAYMAPEQIKGEDVGRQADIWALGVVTYEMITGKRPFTGDSETSLIFKIINENPQPLKSLNPAIPTGLDRIIKRTLAKYSGARYKSPRELLNDLEACTRQLDDAGRGRFDLQNLKDKLRRPGVAVPTALAALLLALLVVRHVDRQANIRWAQTEAPVKIDNLISEFRYAAAFSLAREALSYVPDDATLEDLLESTSVPVSIASDPPGARFLYKTYTTPDAPWQEAGTTPLDEILLPRQHLHWRMELDGHEPVEGSFSTLYRTLDVTLHPAEETMDGMVRVPQGSITFGGERVELDAFWLDRFEVTNREFARFVAAGGYENEEYWQKALENSDLTWEEARQAFRDRTGRPGPAGWELGSPPDGLEDYPVGGISWYEAAAYCNFANKDLPAIYHWRRATGLNREIYTDIHSMSNFSGEGPAPPGQYAGISRYGAYDMAGNMKEWVWNSTGERRYILGGAWNESEKMYQADDARPPLDRNKTFGVRCVQYIKPVPEELFEPLEKTYYDFTGYEPVDDDVFEIFKRIYRYQPGPLEVSDKQVAESRHWRRETVSYSAGYSDERMTLHLYIPHDASPPYQTVIHFPGSYALAFRSSETPSDLAMFDFIIRSGRVLAYPVYQHTYERYRTEETVYRRDIYIQWSHELGRTLDYLETREDIDHETTAFLAFSLGATPGPIFGAIHDRISSMILFASGLTGGMRNWAPELFPLNFAPRVQVPVMMISGEDDVLLGPPEKGRVPLFNQFGTPDEHKNHVLLEGNHIPDDWSAFIRETLDWLDRYQKPAKHATL